MKEKAIYVGYNNHDAEPRFECPFCSIEFGGWDVFRNEPNENGTEKYCPHCKEELEGL